MLYYLYKVGMVMKKIIFLVAFLLLGINLTGTLSLFESKIDVPVEAELASWKIKVNDILIGQETDFELFRSPL